MRSVAVAPASAAAALDAAEDEYDDEEEEAAEEEEATPATCAVALARVAGLPRRSPRSGL